MKDKRKSKCEGRGSRMRRGKQKKERIRQPKEDVALRRRTKKRLFKKISEGQRRPIN